ncbi:polysaccharide biosynthesis/export family protein [Devosia sp. MC521]|uniref:polysaccharide biosynthesis/export family protein n=1 Tax=Devosia sp. MC521 TaxID=2759954 RepID=UPI0015F86C4A|nr:polysaccharide biosynthesis/export family protein [Devosia sp. MC521]MBJ6986846.1 polysaccharide export protein [Devosia sp. MC521]QMW63879.1 polysaccharide export protein [Devosia sp. MC521]
MRCALIIALVLPVMLGACTTTRPTAYSVETRGPYQLDTGDTVRVSVYGDPEISKSYRVDDKGAIAFPLVGAVQVRGTTTEQASKRLASALANGYMRSPDVAVEVEQYRPFYIAGEVKTSGQFPYVYGMTARAAIATAGGFTPTADRNQVVVYRRQADKMGRSPVPLDFPIAPGDTVVVSERWF